MNLRPEDVFLGQGTLRPDLIESASSIVSNKAEVIKTHHNDTELIRQLRDQGRVVEPLKDFHKDEVTVRKLKSRFYPRLKHILKINFSQRCGNWGEIWVSLRIW